MRCQAREVRDMIRSALEAADIAIKRHVVFKVAVVRG